jgi:2-polyprenyl-3-methyl-5-hydroxy-6-metoxy-1,4-benzoquinol methylase
MTLPTQSALQEYARQADRLAEAWERVSFAEVHQPMLHLIPARPCDIVDIGAGTGRDAAAFADMGHRVLAVEPTAELRTSAKKLHPSGRIEWLDDTLPELAHLARRGQDFDLVMLTAVWMHLDPQQRQLAMPRVAALVRIGGAAMMSLRHGPLPAGRRMFDVSAEETIALAQTCGLDPVLQLLTPSTQLANQLAGVTWTRLAFAKRTPITSPVPRHG